RTECVCLDVEGSTVFICGRHGHRGTRHHHQQVMKYRLRVGVEAALTRDAAQRRSTSACDVAQHRTASDLWVVALVLMGVTVEDDVHAVLCQHAFQVVRTV